jgi:enoyl-CoA hydratase/carnithine racemase
MTGQVHVETDAALATITLSHPGKFNAMSRLMWRQLRSAFEDIQRSKALSCVVIRGEDGNFCAGGDISEYAQFRFEENTLREFHEDDVWGALQAMLDCDVPIIAQIEGNCMGAGIEISSCCDLRFSGQSARFGAPIARLGFPMAPREAELVLRAVGDMTAREMLLSAAVLDAATMAQRGFLNRVLDDNQLADAVQATVAGMLKLSTQAARLNKQALRTLRSPINPQLAVSLANAYAYADSPDHREGVTAFLEKRSPQF